MELLDRYLQAVRFWLPRAQQADIITELGDDLRSQMEDKESALGRPLNEDETVALLQQTGHPMRVAGRYQPQQSLIGPTLFPLYRFVIKCIAFGYLAPWLLVWGGLLFFWPSYRADHTVLGAWASFWSLAFSFFGMITIAFAVMERYHTRITWLNHWDPRKLPRVVERKQRASRVSRVESVFGLVFSIIFAIWWLNLPRYGHWLLGPADGMIAMNPALRAYHLPFLVPTLILIVQQCINLFRPQWTWLRAIALLVANAATLGVVQSAINHYPYVMLAQGVKDAARYAEAEFIVNQVFLWSFVCAVIGISIALIVHAFQTIRELWRLFKRRQAPPAVQISQIL
ncbi:MAG TPA: hypothetical protein VH724_08640 [Candidatus Angelobacter sp.]|nr:hypothetical protein [Candidatus Angelobacter sp.]